MDKIFCIIGPTASGKTDISLNLASKLPIEIVSIDAAMVYQEMDIGTAKPDLSIRNIIPHHLIDLISPLEIYSVAQCLKDIFKACKDIHKRGNIPLLVGGTMMYFHAIKYGLADLPEADLNIRKDLAQETLKYGIEHLHTKLQKYDPISAQKIHTNDVQRIHRALEIYMLTGKTRSELQKFNNSLHNYDFIDFILLPEDRALIHKRIELRFQNMLTQGFLDEVSYLKEKYQLTLDNPSMRSVGYRQAMLYLDNKLDKKFWEEKAIAATRQLAKRQITWLRQWGAYHIFHDIKDSNFIVEKILNIMHFSQD